MKIDRVADPGIPISCTTPSSPKTASVSSKTFVRSTCALPGVMAECGTYKGGSAALVSRTCPHKTLHVFDSLGIPEDDPGGVHRRGEFANTEAELRDFLAPYNVQIHVGVFPHTAEDLDEVFSFVHLDMDIYTSTKAGLDYFGAPDGPRRRHRPRRLQVAELSGGGEGDTGGGLIDRLETPVANQGYVRF